MYSVRRNADLSMKFNQLYRLQNEVVEVVE